MYEKTNSLLVLMVQRYDVSVSPANPFNETPDSFSENGLSEKQCLKNLDGSQKLAIFAA